MMRMFIQQYAQVFIFKGMDPDQLLEIQPYLHLRRFEKDTVIFQQGQSADQLFVLLEGEVEIRFKPYDGPPLTVARILPNGIFGWSAALGRPFYTSAAIATQDSEAFSIISDDLRKLYEKNPVTGGILLERLASAIAERLRSTHTEILTILIQHMDLDQKRESVKDECE